MADEWRRRPTVALVLSVVIPGAGHMYAGMVGIGFLYLAVVVVGYLFHVALGLLLHIVAALTAFWAGLGAPDTRDR